jgi:hypothetical protein
VRLISKLAGVAAVAVAVSCGGDVKGSDADVNRDRPAPNATGLDLANQQPTTGYSMTENLSANAPAPTKHLKLDSTGAKVIPSTTPTLAAAVDTAISAVSSTIEIPQVQIIEHIALSSTVEALPAVARPRNTAGGFGTQGSGGDLVSTWGDPHPEHGGAADPVRRGHGGVGSTIEEVILNVGPMLITGRVSGGGGGVDDDRCLPQNIIRRPSTPVSRQPIGSGVSLPGATAARMPGTGPRR